MKRARKIVSSALLIVTASGIGAAAGEVYYQSQTPSEKIQETRINRCAAAILSINSEQYASTENCDKLGYYDYGLGVAELTSQRDLRAKITREVDNNNDVTRGLDIVVGLFMGATFSAFGLSAGPEILKERREKAAYKEMTPYIEEIFNNPEEVNTGSIMAMESRPPRQVEQSR